MRSGGRSAFEIEPVELPVHLVVARVDEALAVEVLREDLRVLVDRAVLHHRAGLVLQLELEAELVREEEELGAVGPGLHVAVEVGEVGVLLVRLEERLDVVAPAEEARQLRLAGADVAGDRDEALACYGHAAVPGSDPVDEDEQPEPDDVDEVPVPGDRLEGEVLARREVAFHAPQPDHDQHDRADQSRAGRGSRSA